LVGKEEKEEERPAVEGDDAPAHHMEVKLFPPWPKLSNHVPVGRE
jgi:hypothetical protein